MPEGSSPKIKIFVAAHKPVDLFEASSLVPVQVGAALASERFSWAAHDDEGENISSENPLYCELTAQYWAWKNVEADYYGFCHYRRYFDFSDVRHKENPWGEVMEDYIGLAARARYGLDDATIAHVVEGYDVITTEFKDLRRFPGGVGTPRRHFELADRLREDDLDRVVAILKDLHPDYAEDADAFLDGHSSCFCNMFIMRREPFFAYCEWLFPILARFVAETDMSDYSVEALRTPGHLAERLFNIYYLHQMRQGSGWRTRELQCVHFVHPERHAAPEPLPAGGAPVVPIVLAADDAYVPMLATTIRSALMNASPERRYDVVVLERDISPVNKELLREMVSQTPSASLRFCDAGRLVEGYDLNELGDAALAAARDLDFCGNLGYRDGKRRRYAREVLGLADPFGYFQAGVLVLNTAAMRRLHSTDEWLRLAGDDRLMYNDQDLLNKECQGRVVYLEGAWNVLTEFAGRIERVFAYAPAAIFKDYLRGRACPRIVHYAGAEKPWSTIGGDFFELYWRYARETPFYEALLARLAGAPVVARSSQPRAIGEDNPLRKVVDPLLPIGSRRRELARAIGIAISGKK